MTLKVIERLKCYVAEPVRPLIHDDGSLTDDDEAELTASSFGAKVVRKSEADDLVLPRLSNYPGCTRARAVTPFALKLLDIFLSTKDGPLAFCDSDILFMRPVRGFFDASSETGTAVFMEDVQTGYACHPFRMFGRDAIRLPARLNAGLFCFPREKYDLDFIEHTLQRHILGPRAVPHLIEQTCWAALAWRAGCRFYDPRQVAMVTDDTIPDQHLVAAHLATSHGRHRWDEFLRLPPVSNAEPVNIRTIPADRLNPITYSIRRARTRIGNLIRK